MQKALPMQQIKKPGKNARLEITLSYAVITYYCGKDRQSALK
jgi:hypothetical protein